MKKIMAVILSFSTIIGCSKETTNTKQSISSIDQSATAAPVITINDYCFDDFFQRYNLDFSVDNLKDNDRLTAYFQMFDSSRSTWGTIDSITIPHEGIDSSEFITDLWVFNTSGEGRLKASVYRNGTEYFKKKKCVPTKLCGFTKKKPPCEGCSHQ